MKYTREKDIAQRVKEYRRLGKAKGIHSWKTADGEERFLATITDTVSKMSGKAAAARTVYSLEEVMSDRLDLELKYGIDKREEWLRLNYNKRWSRAESIVAEFNALGKVKGIRSRDTAKGKRFNAYISVKKSDRHKFEGSPKSINGPTFNTLDEAAYNLYRLEKENDFA